MIRKEEANKLNQRMRRLSRRRCRIRKEEELKWNESRIEKK